MAIDPVQAIHTSAVAQNIAAVDSEQRNPSSQTRPPGVPTDKVTISPEAQARQADSTGNHDHGKTK